MIIYYRFWKVLGNIYSAYRLDVKACHHLKKMSK
jgi:hypothetical protein